MKKTLIAISLILSTYGLITIRDVFASGVSSGGGGAGIASINADSTSAQVIAGSNNISASTAGGTTTINGTLLAPKASPTFTGNVTVPLSPSRAVVTDGSSVLTASAVTSTELALLSGKTSVGDFSGPGSSTADGLVTYSDTTGKVGVSRSNVTLPSTGVLTFGTAHPMLSATGTIQQDGSTYRTIYLADVRAAATNGLYGSGMEIVWKMNGANTGRYGGAYTATVNGTGTTSNANWGFYSQITAPGSGNDCWGSNACNAGLLNAVSSSTATGHNVGTFNVANNAIINYGTTNYAYSNTRTGGDNVGTYSLASTYGSVDSAIGGWFVLASTQYPVTDPDPATITTALLADNGAVAAPIFLAKDNGTTVFAINDAGGVVVGSPTGGDKGAGTVNAVAVYDDNTLLTDFVFEPGYKMLSITEMEKFFKKENHLPTIDGKDVWEREGKFPLGKIASQLWETVEVQAVYIAQLNHKIEDQEKRIKKLEATVEKLIK